MKYFYNIYGLFILLGIFLLITILIIYRLKKRQHVGKPTKEGDLPMVKMPEKLDILKFGTDLDTLKEDPPAFIKYAVDMLVRFKDHSTMKVIEDRIKLYNIHGQYLDALLEYQGKVDKIEDYPETKKRKQELDGLEHRRAVADLQKKIREIDKPEPEVPPKPSPTIIHPDFEKEFRDIDSYEKLLKIADYRKKIIDEQYSDPRARDNLKMMVDDKVRKIKIERGW
ncbi:MAG: hypothetical protein MUP41_07900 [Desulfobacterales bacterium]|nr:hypothetical protein [Desulfobacterales bacterium]